MDATDAIASLDIAACILAATEYMMELLSTAQISHAQHPLTLCGRDQHAVLETLKNLRISLSNCRLPSAPAQSSANTPSPSSDALRGLISSRDASVALLDDVDRILRGSGSSSRSQQRETDTKAGLTSRVADAPDVEQLKRLHYALTQQISSILT